MEKINQREINEIKPRNQLEERKGILPTSYLLKTSCKFFCTIQDLEIPFGTQKKFSST